MKKNKKYLLAAQLIVDFELKYVPIIGCYVSCEALRRVRQPAINYTKLFKPKDIHTEQLWFDHNENYNPQLARQLALLLMYEMGEE
jgi:hypothetical protein